MSQGHNLSKAKRHGKKKATRKISWAEKAEKQAKQAIYDARVEREKRVNIAYANSYQLCKAVAGAVASFILGSELHSRCEQIEHDLVHDYDLQQYMSWRFGHKFASPNFALASDFVCCPNVVCTSSYGAIGLCQVLEIQKLENDALLILRCFKDEGKMRMWMKDKEFVECLVEALQNGRQICFGVNMKKKLSKNDKGMVAYWFREICGGCKEDEVFAAKFYRWYKEEIANCRKSCKRRAAKCEVWKEPSLSSTAIQDILTDIEWELMGNPKECPRIEYREFAKKCNALRASYESEGRPDGLETQMDDHSNIRQMYV